MKRSTLVTLLTSFLYVGSLSAASDYLLELDGVKGESKDDKHKGAIEIESFSWGVSNTGASSSGGGGGTGKVSFQDFHFTTRISKASPQLMLACATGQHIPTATLYVRKAGGGTNEYYTITLEEVLISSMSQNGPGSSTGGATADTTPSDKVMIYFNAMTVNHTADDGTVTTGRAVRTPVQ